MGTLPLRPELATEDREGLKWFRSELWRGAYPVTLDGREAVTEWTRHPTVAMNDGRDLVAYVRAREDEITVAESLPAAKVAHDEALALFA